MQVQHWPGEQTQAETQRAASRPPRFSIVMPLHDKAAYVRASLGSVLAQSLPDLEVIVVDDGSTDDGARIAASLGDPRVRIESQPNAGVSMARNRAIALARGEWVVFLDADDWQHPAFLAGLAAVQEMHPDVDMVATRYREFEDCGGQSPQPWDLPVALPVVERIGDLAARWMKAPTLFTGSVAVRRRLLERLQPCFPPGESYGEDLDLWFRLSERTPIALAHVPLAGYRRSVAGSLTHRAPRTGLPPWVSRLRERALSPGYDPARRRSALALIAQFRLSLAREGLAAGDRAGALASLVAASAAAGSARWWLTALMVLAWPAPLVRRFLEAGTLPPLRERLEPTLDVGDFGDWAAAVPAHGPALETAQA